ncbi:hypothetical protein N658DRAFT_483237 [Parathielavia hyrcaniae]|uniref:Uncharacterized protein n=1 Tax=Parathielavia hyrcaniae TaxID=113614 RepID=A0AAN6Q922_9PEZI|nr:hypothetical protein N658DRAFT_483237 [Parathielavia hyrcaniae]
MADFPKLIPAFTLRVAIAPPQAISDTLNFVRFLAPGGSIASDPSYPVQLNAALEHGADFITLHPGGRHVCLDVQSLARDAGTGTPLRLTYRGKIATTGAAGRVLRGEDGAGTTSFGEACDEFEVGGGTELAVLGEKVFVGSGRFVIEPGKPVIVEYKVSEVSG